MKNIQDKITWLTERKLVWGIVVLVVIQVQGYLPNLDFLTPKTLKILSFSIAVVLSCVKGVEMFFDQSLSLAKKEETKPE